MSVASHWSALHSHAERLLPIHIKDLFARDADRFQEFLHDFCPLPSRLLWD